MRFAWQPLILVLVLHASSPPPVRAEVPQEGWMIWASDRQAGRLEGQGAAAGAAIFAADYSSQMNRGPALPTMSPKRFKYV